MFFKQVRRNAVKNRKGNGLFFGSLVIAIIAFYTLLSLGEQDVMLYLAAVESDAVRKLMALLPVVYGVSLFFVFFLVYFACKYQTDSRRRELGLYLMLGMRRSRLFALLFCETLWSSLLSLLFGLSAALFLTEGISLATARLVGLGIIGHRFSFSAYGLCWTVCGFVLVQLLSMLVICVGLGKTEPADLFHAGSAEEQRVSERGKLPAFVLGLGLLLTAYYHGVTRMRTLDILVLLALVVCGISGTFLLYRGLGGLIGLHIRRQVTEAAGLQTFTARQIQEGVLSQHKSLAVSSLLLMMALACVSYGVSMGLGRSGSSRSIDFSLFGKEEEIDAALEKEGLAELVKDSHPLYLSMVKNEYFRGEVSEFDTRSLKEALRTVEGFEDRAENIIENLHLEYVIAQSSYNYILRSVGKDEICLSDCQAAIYTSVANDGDIGRILEKALAHNAAVGIDGVDYELVPRLCCDNVVADRAITLYMALIVPDELYVKLAREQAPYCRNVRLSDEAVADVGLMQAVQKADRLLAETEIKYDSFLGGIGRNLFYTVAASYLSIYLGILFWLIANTVIGLKYLIGQRRTRHRYETLLMLGADMPSMCRSVGKQILAYFLLVLCVALVSSVAAICTLFTSFTRLPVGVSVPSVVMIAAAVLIIFGGIEVLYICVVRRMADREMCRIEITNRG